MTLVAVLIGLFSLTACAKGKQPVPFQDLPEMVKAAVQKVYTQEQISYITWEKALGKDEYEFMLVDGTKMEYYETGQLHEIKSAAGVPDALIPDPILNYVRTTIPNAIITEYKNDPYKQEVELNNDMELVFNRRGDFLRID